MLMPLLQFVLPPGAVGDVEAKDTLPDAGSSGHEGPVVRWEVLVAVVQFVMVFDLTGVPRCFLVARGFCVVPLCLLTLQHWILGPIWKVLGE